MRRELRQTRTEVGGWRTWWWCCWDRMGWAVGWLAGLGLGCRGGEKETGDANLFGRWRLSEQVGECASGRMGDEWMDRRGTSVTGRNPVAAL